MPHVRRRGSAPHRRRHVAVIDHSEDKIPRTHWDMLLERRSRAELEELLEERLAFIRARRGAGEDVTAEKIGA